MCPILPEETGTGRLPRTSCPARRPHHRLRARAGEPRGTRGRRAPPPPQRHSPRKAARARARLRHRLRRTGERPPVHHHLPALPADPGRAHLPDGPARRTRHLREDQGDLRRPHHHRGHTPSGEHRNRRSDHRHGKGPDHRTRHLRRPRPRRRHLRRPPAPVPGPLGTPAFLIRPAHRRPAGCPRCRGTRLRVRRGHPCSGSCPRSRRCRRWCGARARRRLRTPRRAA